MKNKLIIILLSLLSTQLYALEKIECRDSDSLYVEEKVFISNIGKLNCEFYQDVIDTLRDINDFNSVDAVVNIILSDRSFSASFDLGSNLEIPQQFIRQNKAGDYHFVSNEATVGIVAHEYGHAILSSFLAQELPSFNNLFQLQKKISKLKIRAFGIRLLIKDPKTSVSERISLQNELLTIAKKMKELKSKRNNENYERFFNLMLPYQELLADVITVYNYNDKDFLVKIVDHPKYSKLEKEVVVARSFNQVDVELSKENEQSPHAKLYLVRQYIGSNLWPTNSHQKREYIDKILRAIRASLEEELYGPLPSLNYKAQSKRLISKLKSMR
ncbi:hypothetical protein [Halobacteriovorax sp.]|uniref:hypothetical protein n=1 Tax=Halobacteriovorax sp. TaxID=2020862 RepID=UPI003AF21479